MVDLGFVEKCEPWLLESRFFPSKVGGKPAWLDLKNIPNEKDLACEYCGDPCIFLCQIYAPYDQCQSAFHRTIFVFICKKAECCKLNSNGNLKVLRSQLPINNEFYPSEPPVEKNDWRTDISVHKWVKTCHVCGISAPNHCSKCKTTNYCSRSHQVYDWKNGHKARCGSNDNESQKFLFPEYKLEMESEDLSSSDSDESENEEELKKLERMTEEGTAGTMQNEDVQNELTAMANHKEDETFSQFQAIVKSFPDQVLRYERGGKILYIASENKVTEVPKCPECNAERQFEFQIMPQLLNFLELGNILKSVDWGILAVFTCKKSCVPRNGYTSEYIWKQDIVEENPDPSVTNNV